eukprot:CAMPEP_0196791832 /NCGR_PEP_ID=MMETSP1104-20130614/30424_1 /TAXON_ID=33652 /ORGANISM="Cafeteria sp., Strain Caron Lab Isolate" /LENGTH=166 /DNA_ID=CAMNT_0042162195 /DNA_START=1 /DNA_END=498 /DNA_ORIENTATION=-
MGESERAQRERELAAAASQLKGLTRRTLQARDLFLFVTEAAQVLMRRARVQVPPSLAAGAALPAELTHDEDEVLRLSAAGALAVEGASDRQSPSRPRFLPHRSVSDIMTMLERARTAGVSYKPRGKLPVAGTAHRIGVLSEGAAIGEAVEESESDTDSGEGEGEGE